MLMFLTILFISTLSLAVTSLAFAISESDRKPSLDAQPDRKPTLDPPRFFAGDVAGPSDPSRLPLEVVLTQIERHVRLEQAAAETFLAVPSPETLHSRTPSAFVN